MRLLGYFAGACVALALLQTAVKLAVLLVLSGCFVAFVRRPRETIALVITLGVLNLVTLYPLPALGVVGVLAAGKQIARWRGVGLRPNGKVPEARRITQNGDGDGDGT